MKIPNKYQVTIKDKKFARKITKGINKDFPNVAEVINGCCFITEEHWDKCKRLVQHNSKFK